MYLRTDERREIIAHSVSQTAGLSHSGAMEEHRRSAPAAAAAAAAAGGGGGGDITGPLAQ